MPLSAYVACMKSWHLQRLVFLVVVAVCPVLVCAQDDDKAAQNSDVRRDLAALREAVIQQTRQIDALTAEVARLNRVIAGSKSTASSAPTATLPAPKALSASTPVQEVGVSDPQESPVAEAASGPEHEVQKGESLSSIAKKYGTTIDALAKLNHITDPRKLLAGQKLKLPPAAVATPAAASPAAVSPAPSAAP